MIEIGIHYYECNVKIWAKKKKRKHCVIKHFKGDLDFEL